MNSTGSSSRRPLPDLTRLRALNPVSRARSAGFPFSSAPTPASVDPLPGPALGDRYDSDWARRPLARLTRVTAQETVGRAVTLALCSPQVVNRDRIDALDGSAVFVANHHSHLDSGVVTGALPRPWRHKLIVAAAADYFFDTPTRAAAAAWFWGAVPMERKRVSRRSALAAAELIDQGWSLLLFPEGGRSPDGWGQEHKGGAAYLAVRCGVPVVPIHIHGTDRVLPKGTSRPRPGRVVINFGAPMHHGDLDARRFAARVEATLELLAEETVSDWYSARLAAARDGSPGLRGPDIDTWRRDWLLERRAPATGGPVAPRRSEKQTWRDKARGNPPW